MARKEKPSAPRQKPGAALADKLARLGIARDADLVLHLPLRYEDHTRVVPLATLAAGSEQQAEGTVVTTDIQYRPRRQLVCLLEDGADAAGRLRVFCEMLQGHLGREILPPQFPFVAPGAALPDRLTPVYPTTAGLAQETLRKVVARAVASDAALTTETLPERLVKRRELWTFGDAVRFLHAPPPRLPPSVHRSLEAREHPACS